jgi:hypothetical protein
MLNGLQLVLCYHATCIHCVDDSSVFILNCFVHTPSRDACNKSTHQTSIQGHKL